jgi:hypothetical protein
MNQHKDVRFVSYNVVMAANLTLAYKSSENHRQSSYILLRFRRDLLVHFLHSELLQSSASS